MKTISKIAAIALVAVAVVGVNTASAATVAELQAMIAQLTAQIAALSGTPSTPAAVTFTSNLTVGSRGAEVTALQNFLIGKGYNTLATGYFGPMTKAALAAYQTAKGITPAVGYFGPLTRAAVNGEAAVVVVPPTTPGTVTAPGLQGGAGSIDGYTLMSSLNNEEVGEDESDVEVAGIEIENSDDSDIEIKAVKLVFNEGTATSDFEDYADEVAIMLDGKEVGRVDATRFNDDNEWTSTVGLKGAVIKSGDDDAELTVAITGVSNLDSDDANDTWTVDITSVRYEDAEGTVLSEDPGTNATTFSFDTFASAANVELKVSLADESPSSKVVDVDDTDDTDGITVAVFSLKAEGGDIELKDLPVTFTATNPAGSGADDVDDVINSATLVIEGKDYSETINTSAIAATTTFTDIDYVIKKGTTVKVTVKVDVNDTQAASFVDGDTIKAEITTTNRNNINAEDETGEDLATTDMTGTALGDEIAFYDSGIMVDFVSAVASAQVDDGSDDDTGIFTIKFKVTAFDATAYIASTSAATGTLSTNILATSLLGNLYAIDKSGTATTSNVSSQITYVDASGDAETTTDGNIELEDGEAATVTLTVTRQNAGGASDNGLYRAILRSVAWAASEAPTAWNAYDFDLTDFKTDPISLD